MIRAVAFDVMDTLLTDPFREALRAATGLSVDELIARRDPAIHPAFERGELDEHEYWRAFESAGIPADRDRFHRVRQQRTQWIAGMRELLEQLQGRVVRAAASNYPVWIEQLAAGPLAGRVEFVIASCHVGVRKPDPGFYEAVLAQLQLPAGQVLFVDDRPANVAGAEAVGLGAHRFTDVDALRSWLVGQQVLPAPDDASPSPRSAQRTRED